MAESIIINPGDRNSEMAAKRTSPGAQSRKILSSPQNGKNVSHWVDGRLPVRMAILAVALLSASCGWQTSVSFRSPSGAAAISVGRGYGPMARLEVELSTRNGTRRVYRSSGEVYSYFVEPYWSPDEKLAGIVITGTAQWTLAFSIADGKEVPFGLIRPQMEAALRERYRIPDDTSAIQWTYTDDARQQYSKLHPGIY
jgi:hypothetical protein